jgi:hypothetical protein
MEHLDGSEILTAGSKYECDEPQYGHWKVWEDIELLVIYPREAGNP